MKSSLPAAVPTGSFCWPMERLPRKGPRKKSSIIPKRLAGRNSSARCWPEKVPPLIAVRQLPAAGEFQMDDAAVELHWGTGRAAGVIEERAHGEDVPCPGEDGRFVVFVGRGIDFVGASEDPQRAIIRHHVVQMNPERQHLLQDFPRSFHMR